MAQSTTNLLAAVNKVLLNVGERSTTTLSRPAPTKAKNFIQEAFNEVQIFHDWEWLYNLVAISSWSNERATINNCRRIRQVSWLSDSTTSTGNLRPIPFVEIEPFEHFKLESFDSTKPNSKPLWWTKVNEDTIKLNPYPSDATMRARIRVNIISYFSPPTNTTDLFNCPERFLDVILKRATSLMYARHLGDLNASQNMEREFQENLVTFRTKERGIPTGHTNIFKRNYNGYF